MKPPSSDPQLRLEGIRQGEEWAYIELFDEYYAPLHNYATRLLHDVEAANDVVQEVFCHLFETRSSLSPSSQLMPLLLRSVYNRAITTLRHTMVMQDYADQEQQDFLFNQLLQHPEAEIALRQQDIQLAVREALSHLTPRCREVFIMSKMQGMTNRQIAERLGTSVKTVEAQMTRSLASMRKDLEWLLLLLWFTHLGDVPGNLL